VHLPLCQTAGLGIRAPLFIVAILTLAGCTSTPLGATARKGAPDAAEQEVKHSSAWPGDDDRGASDDKRRYHRVRPGESFADVASLFGITVPQLLNANHGLDPADGLKPGEVLYIPRQK